MTPAKEAFKRWEKTQTQSMKVYTNIEMFELGFDTATELMDQMADHIIEQELEIEQLEKEIKKLKKNAKLS